jgi:hypothetical protein
VVDRMEVKFDEILRRLEIISKLLSEKPKRHAKSNSSKQRTVRPKPQPLSETEISKYATQFDKLFQDWQTGRELEVERYLENLDADEVRRFADANNLNVTTKMPKPKMLSLIAGRFRERRQLLRPNSRRDEPAG